MGQPQSHIGHGDDRDGKVEHLEHQLHDPSARPHNFVELSMWGKTSNTVSRYTRVSQRAYDKIAIWSGPIGLSFFALIFPAGSFLPPIHPARNAEEVLDHYRRHESGIKGGAALMQFAGCFYSLYIAAISGQMARIPGASHAMISSQAISGGISTYTITLPSLIFCLASYRLETRSAELIMLLNDLAWFLTVMPFVTFVSGNFAWSYAILMDKRPKPLFPHWFAYFSSVWPFGFWGALGMHCVYGGAWAWDGGYTFWTGAAAVGIGTTFSVYFLLKAVNTTDEECEGQARDVEPNVSSDKPVNGVLQQETLPVAHGSASPDSGQNLR